jgi:hypothetical protein
LSPPGVYNRGRALTLATTRSEPTASPSSSTNYQGDGIVQIQEYFQQGSHVTPPRRQNVWHHRGPFIIGVLSHKICCRSNIFSARVPTMKQPIKQPTTSFPQQQYNVSTFLNFDFKAVNEQEYGSHQHAHNSSGGCQMVWSKYTQQ